MAGWFGDGFSDACGGYGDEISLDFAGPGGLLAGGLQYADSSGGRVCRYARVDYQKYNVLWVGLGTEFRSEKIPRNRLGTVSVIPRNKVLIPRHSDFRGRDNSEARNGTEFCEKNKFYKTARITQHNDLSKVVFSYFGGLINTPRTNRRSQLRRFLFIQKK
jgi:hypothetical protein